MSSNGGFGGWGVLAGFAAVGIFFAAIGEEAAGRGIRALVYAALIAGVGWYGWSKYKKWKRGW